MVMGTNQEQAESVRPHGLTAKVFHWGFIGVFVYALTKQLDEVEELEDLSLLHYEMAFASVFLLLLIVRFVFMQSTRPSALPDETPASVRRLARTVHLAMYASLSLIAVTGLTIGGLYWSGAKTGVAIELALILHEIAVNVSYALIIGHVAAAIYHRRKQDGIWNAMVPVGKRTD